MMSCCRGSVDLTADSVTAGLIEATGFAAKEGITLTGFTIDAVAYDLLNPGGTDKKEVFISTPYGKIKIDKEGDV